MARNIRRYSVRELMAGVDKDFLKALHAQVAPAMAGPAIGREVLEGCGCAWMEDGDIRGWDATNCPEHNGIRSEAEYHRDMAALEEIFERAKPGTPEGARFERLAARIEIWDRRQSGR